MRNISSKTQEVEQFANPYNLPHVPNHFSELLILSPLQDIMTSAFFLVQTAV